MERRSKQEIVADNVSDRMGERETLGSPKIPSKAPKHRKHSISRSQKVDCT